MVWYSSQIRTRHGLGDIVYQNTNLLFNIHSSTYSSFNLYNLWCVGVNIFNVDRTIHNHEFFKDICTKISEARIINGTELYRPIGVAVTLSTKMPVEINEDADIIIVKDILNKDDLLMFRRMYSFLNKPILVWISSEKMDDLNFIIKLSDGVIYEDTKVYLSQCTCLYKKCREMHKPIILYRPVDIEEYLDNFVKLLPIARKLDALSLDGFLLEDTGCQKNIVYAVYNFFISLIYIDSSKQKQQRKRDYMEIRAELKLPVLPPLSMAHAAILAALNSEATLIMVMSRSGRSAKWISCARPPCYVVVITSQAATARKLHVYKQIIPLLYDQRSVPTWQEEFSNRVKFGTDFAQRIGLLAYGAKFVVLSQHGDEGYCNHFQILRAHEKIMYQQCPFIGI
ncbi:hypothetical protein O0L34_g4244 [Tuta absoluta]|nr:hypothetical protein O0L34_g4244 [Tuta absoluta]